MAQLKDTIIDGNLDVSGSLTVGDATIDGHVTFDSGVKFSGWNREVKGSYVHIAQGTYTSAGYVKLAQIKIGHTYPNAPIQFTVIKRGNDPHTYTIRFSNSSGTDPDIASFTHSPYDCKGFLVKSATSTWDFYLYKVAYDDITVTDVSIPNYAQSLNRTTIEWLDEGVTSLPSGSISSSSEYVHATGMSIWYGNASNSASTMEWATTIANSNFSSGVNYGVGIKLSNNAEGLRKWAGIGAIADNGYSNQTSMAFYVSSDPDTSIEAYRMVYDRFKPNGNDVRYLGDSVNKWKSLYAVTGTIQTSDRNKKENIVELDEKYESLFNQLKPVTYDFKGDNHDRTHVGFISQDIEDSLSDVGLTAMDFAGFCKDIKKEADEEGNEHDVLDENGNPVYEYALRYEEFIALNTHMIQKANAKIAEQQSEIDTLKEMVYALKSEVDELKSNK